MPSMLEAKKTRHGFRQGFFSRVRVCVCVLRARVRACVRVRVCVPILRMRRACVFCNKQYGADYFQTSPPVDKL